MIFLSMPSRHRCRGITTDTPKRRICGPRGSFSTPLFCGAFRLDKARSGHGKLSQGDTTSQADGINPPLGRLKRHHDLPNNRTVQKVQRRIKFSRFFRRLLKSVRARSSFQRKDNACLSLPPNIFSRIYPKVVHLYQDIQPI